MTFEGFYKIRLNQAFKTSKFSAIFMKYYRKCERIVKTLTFAPLNYKINLRYALKFELNCYFCIVKPQLTMKIILLTIVAAAILLGLAFLIMGVKVWFVKGGKFPTGHAHDIPELKKRGIGCAHRDCKP